MHQPYTGHYTALPQDIRPMGSSNLNQLVYHNLGSNSYDVVACVHANLIWLHKLHEQLAVAANLNQLLTMHSRTLYDITNHINELWCISASMPALKRIHDNLPIITKNADYIHTLNERLQDTEKELKAINMHLSKDLMNEAITKYNEILANTKKLESLITNLSTLEKDTLHFKCTDAVTLAMFTKKIGDIDKATEVIKASVTAGNNEDINIDRLESI